MALTSITPLALVMAEQKVSQVELTRRSGLARKTVVDAYHGKGVELPSWIRIAKALDVPLMRIAPDAAAELEGLRIA